ncbi:MAG TPA: alpha/beta fold hydrolase [Natronosporangium sp.]|nr:alpha/beta fold hydrolase [Natronosporangium sp.]
MLTTEPVVVAAGAVTLAADLTIPEHPAGVVLFAHGSGSSRHSPRNRQVAAHLHEHRFVTVLADLLTEEEAEADAQTGQFRFDIELLSQRVVTLVDWAGTEAATQGHPIGLFGASTGAAAALMAAAKRPAEVRAVVSRGGRPDLAARVLDQVTAPTLFLVGSRDRQVLHYNETAALELAAPYRVQVVPNAGHLFEEPGALEQVGQHTVAWFEAHLR